MQTFRPDQRIRIKDPLMSYAVTTFCYGCYLGPMQTSRSLPVLNRKHHEWINRRHITEEKLEKAINVLVNGYNRFSLPTYWGTGETASADGTRWDVYENNLLSEYHVRYGSYGGKISRSTNSVENPIPTLIPCSPLRKSMRP